MKGLKKKLLLITPDFPPQIGGIQNILYNICREVNKSKISVIAPRSKTLTNFDSHQNFRIYRTRTFSDSTKFLIPFMLMKGLSVIKKEKPKLVICGHIYAGPICLLFKKIFNIPYLVFTYALEIMDRRYVNMIKFILKNAERVVVLSDFVGEYLVNLGLKEKIVKIPPSIDTTLFHPDVDPIPVIRKYHLEGKKIILTVGRLDAREQYKGHDIVIRTLPTVLESIPNLRYLIVGGGTDEVRLKRIVKKLHLEDIVVFTGSIPHIQIAQFYTASDLFIMMSKKIVTDRKVKTEGFGIVFAEANACGKPVIGGKSGGVSDAVLDGVTGLLVDPESQKEIANAIVQLLKDRKLSKGLAKRGRERVLQELSLGKIAERVTLLIEGVIS